MPYKDPEKAKEQKRKYYLEHKKECNKRSREYYQDHKEEIDNINKKWQKEHKQEILEIKKKYRKENKEELNRKSRIYAQEHQEEREKYALEHRGDRNKYNRNRKKTDPAYKLTCVLRSRIGKAIKSQRTYKSNHTKDILGCSISYFKQHLESQFKEGMSWKNHGIRGWHIDHIRPCISFDLTDPEQQKECFHYSNMQPLWWHENLSKYNREVLNEK